MSVVFILGIVLLAVLIKPLAQRLHLPFPFLLVLIGFLSSESFIYFGFDTGIRADNFQVIISFIVLPIIVFVSGYKLNPNIFVKHLQQTLLLCLPVLAISFPLITVLLYFAINHPVGFPWLAAAITASILLASSPIALYDYSVKANHHNFLLEGEGIISSFLAIILFAALLKVAISSDTDFHYIQLFFDLFQALFVAIFMGGLAAAFIILVLRLLTQQAIRVMILVLVPYTVYFILQVFFPIAAVLCLFCLGVFISYYQKRTIINSKQRFEHEFLQILFDFANIVLFLLVGIVVTIPMFTERWLAMLIGIIAVLVARSVSIYVSFTFAGVLSPSLNVTKGSKFYLTVAGIRSELLIVLAFSLPMALDYWWTIYAIAFGMMLFSLAVQAPVSYFCYKWIDNRYGGKYE